MAFGGVAFGGVTFGGVAFGGVTFGDVTFDAVLQAVQDDTAAVFVAIQKMRDEVCACACVRVSRGVGAHM